MLFLYCQVAIVLARSHKPCLQRISRISKQETVVFKFLICWIAEVWVAQNTCIMDAARPTNVAISKRHLVIWHSLQHYWVKTFTVDVIFWAWCRSFDRNVAPIYCPYNTRNSSFGLKLWNNSSCSFTYIDKKNTFSALWLVTTSKRYTAGTVTRSALLHIIAAREIFPIACELWNSFFQALIRNCCRCYHR